MITFGSETPPHKVSINLLQLDQFLRIFGKKCILPLEKDQNTYKNFKKGKKMSIGQADVSTLNKMLAAPWLKLIATCLIVI